jgi:hypothetical protein
MFISEEICNEIIFKEQTFVFRRKVLMKHLHEIKGQKGFVRIFLLPLKVSATNEKNISRL